MGGGPSTRPDEQGETPPALSLTCEEGPASIDLRFVDTQAVDFGRDAHCRTVLDHESVSRRHARIEWETPAWRVRDLGSRHGTFVNDVKLNRDEVRTIGAGDVIVIGPWRWRVSIATGGDTTGRADARIALRRDPARGGETFATRPTIFIRLQAGDAAQRELSWHEFHDRYAPVIRGFVRNAGRGGVDAEDVVQDVLLGFFQVAPRFTYDPARGRFRGYLKRCTLNALRRRRGGVPSGGANPGAASPLPVDELDPAEEAETEAPWESAWEAQLFERAVREVASRVDAKTFEAFELYARRGVPADEVARELGIGVNSVHQAKTRVTKLVRELVDAMRDEEG